MEQITFPEGHETTQLKDLPAMTRFFAEAYRIDPEHLDDLRCPFIAHLSNGHYVVVYFTDERSTLIADPATSLHSVSEEKLKKE